MRTAVILLALIASPAAAQEATTLKWSLKEGDKFFAKNVTDMDMKMMFMGQAVDLNMKITAVQRFKVLAAKQDSTTIEMTMVSMDMTAGGAGAGGIPGLGAIGDRMKGATLTAVLDENMAVTKVQGYDKFIEKIAGDDDAMRKQMKQQFSETTMAQNFSEVFSFGTNKPVKVGDTWPRTEKMAVGGVDASVKKKYKFDSLNDGIAKLSLTGDLSFKAGAKLPGLPEGVQIDKFDMKADKFDGSMKFDTKVGRLTESKQDTDMNGSMTLAVAGQKVDMTMNIKVKQMVTIDDKNPIKD